jgi:hypothetical protein
MFVRVNAQKKFAKMNLDYFIFEHKVQANFIVACTPC